VLRAPPISFFLVWSPPQFLIMLFYPLCFCSVRLRHKYSPQHRILKHTQEIKLNIHLENCAFRCFVLYNCKCLMMPCYGFVKCNFSDLLELKTRSLKDWYQRLWGMLVPVFLAALCHTRDDRKFQNHRCEDLKFHFNSSSKF
jgi:hypothetical protein